MIFLTHHKCASSLLHDWVAAFCRLNDLTFFTSHVGCDVPHPAYDVSLLTNAVYACVADKLDGPAIHVIRNPMSIVQSAYYSHLTTHDDAGWPALTAQRAALHAVDRDEGMMRTLHFCERPDFYPATPGPIAQLANWNLGDPRITTVRMEDFGDDLGAVIGAAFPEPLMLPDAADFTFAAKADGRATGEVDNRAHYRSGDPELWRTVLPHAVRDRIRAVCHPLLERFYPAALRD